LFGFNKTNEVNENRKKINEEEKMEIKWNFGLFGLKEINEKK